jgi:hypothetical protein
MATGRVGRTLLSAAFDVDVSMQFHQHTTNIL